MSNRSHHPPRELDTRVSDGIQVRLLWSGVTKALWVAVVDHQSGERFAVDVQDHARALDVFNHPYAYAGAGN